MFRHDTLAHSSNDTTDFQRVADRFLALGFIDHDFSLEGGDGVEEVTFERHAHNLRQLPDYTRFPRRLVFVDKRSSGLESFTLVVGQDNLQPLTFCRRESPRERSQPQHPSVQHCPSPQV